MKYYIILIEASNPKLETVKVLADLSGMCLLDGKKSCENVPCIVKEVDSIEVAEACVKYLTDNGAKAKYQATKFYLW